MTYNPNAWNWQDTVVAILCWSTIPAVFGLRVYLDRKWQKQFGERKPR